MSPAASALAVSVRVAVDCRWLLGLSVAVPITVLPLRNCTLPVGLVLPGGVPGSANATGVAEGSAMLTIAVTPGPAEDATALVLVAALSTTCAKVACAG